MTAMPLSSDDDPPHAKRKLDEVESSPERKRMRLEDTIKDDSMDKPLFGEEGILHGAPELDSLSAKVKQASQQSGSEYCNTYPQPLDSTGGTHPIESQNCGQSDAGDEQIPSTQPHNDEAASRKRKLADMSDDQTLCCAELGINPELLQHVGDPEAQVEHFNHLMNIAGSSIRRVGSASQLS